MKAQRGNRGTIPLRLSLGDRRRSRSRSPSESCAPWEDLGEEAGWSPETA